MRRFLHALSLPMALFLGCAFLLAGCAPVLGDDDDTSDDDDATADDDDDDDSSGDDDDMFMTACESAEAELLNPQDGDEGVPTELDLSIQFTVDGADSLPPDVFLAMSTSPTDEMSSSVQSEKESVSEGLLTVLYRLDPETTYFFEAGCLSMGEDPEVLLVQASFTTGE